MAAEPPAGEAKLAVAEKSDEASRPKDVNVASVGGDVCTASGAGTGAGFQVLGARAQPPAPSRPDYKPPDWAGKPAVGSEELAIELVVRGDVKKRIVLDVEAHNCFLIGRALNCDVVLDGLEPRASRFHCIVQCKAGASELYVYDLKSSHGTLVNGKRIDPHCFVPVRVGEQLKFNADKPTSSDCTAIVCGPDDAMAEESEVDLSAFREQAAKERAETLRAQQADLARRKEAKRKRLHEEAQRKVVTEALAERANKKMQALKEIEEKDRERIHQVTWGEADDAVERPEEEHSEEVQKLLSADGKLDCYKVRQRSLTDKQEQMVTKLEQKMRRLNNLVNEKTRVEGRNAKAQRNAKDLETEFDIIEDKGGGVNLDHVQRLEEKVIKVEEEIHEQTNNLLLSLGLRAISDSGRPNRKRAAMYDTRDEDAEDDFFDRTKLNKTGGVIHKRGRVEATEEATELAGLPTLDGVENKTSLESKVGLLGAEKARLTAQLATEAAKERQRAAATADAGAEEDSLDAFMSGTLGELREYRRAKLQRRMAAVDSRLADAERMLRIAKRNSDEQPIGSGSSATSASSTSLAAGVVAAAAASAAASASAAAVSAEAVQVKPPQVDVAEHALSGHSAVGSGTNVGDDTSRSSRKKRTESQTGGTGSLADTLALLRQQDAIDKPGAAPDENDGTVPTANEGDSSKTAESDSGTAGVVVGVTNNGSRVKKGPQRPPPGALAAVAAIDSTPTQSPGASAALQTATTAEAVAAAAAAMSARKRTPNARHVDVNSAGLQVMTPSPSAGSTRDAPSLDEKAMPPPSKPKKVYGAPRRPTQLERVSSSRDADMEASGELEEPDG